MRKDVVVVGVAVLFCASVIGLYPIKESAKHLSLYKSILSSHFFSICLSSFAFGQGAETGSLAFPAGSEDTAL